MTELLYAMVARVPPAGVAAFAEYEDAVLPLLPAHGGRLDRRVRSDDGTLEIHLVGFASEHGVDSYRADPRRTAAASLLEASQADLELTRMWPAP